MKVLTLPPTLSYANQPSNGDGIKSVLELLDSRSKDLDSSKFGYRLSTGGQYGLDMAFPDEMGIDEEKMSVLIPFADGRRRDGVGDLLEVEGIDTSRHQANPIVLFDHAKTVQLPIALAEDPETKEYTVRIDPVAKIAMANAFFYRGAGLSGIGKDKEYAHALFCEQLFDLIAKRYIRAGSIGYQVVKAVQLQPDYEQGTPPGLHLLQTLMLECSAVVLPANADTVRKVLDMDKVCGKSLSPVLVKSLTPYAPAKTEVVSGYETKSDRRGRQVGAGSGYRMEEAAKKVAEKLRQEDPYHDYWVTFLPQLKKWIVETHNHEDFKLIRLKHRSKMAPGAARQQGLEVIFPPAHQYHERIFYDPKEGKYYDAATDIYLSLDEARAFGIKSIPVSHGDLSKTGVPPARWKPGLGAECKKIRLRYRKKADILAQGRFIVVNDKEEYLDRGGHWRRDKSKAEIFENESLARNAAANFGGRLVPYTGWPGAGSKSKFENLGTGDLEWNLQGLNEVVRTGKDARGRGIEAELAKRKDSTKALPSEGIDPEKACQILRDGTVHKKPLTEKQRSLFGAACGRKKSKELRLEYRNKMKQRTDGHIGEYDRRIKSLQNIRLKYRTTKGLRRRVKRSYPGSSIVYVHGKDIDAVRKAAECKGVKCQWTGSKDGLEKIRLSGSNEDGIDSIVRRFGKKRKSIQLAGHG